MIKKTTLKSIFTSERYPAIPNMTDMIRSLFPKTLLIQTTNCRNVPYLLIKLKSMMPVVVPRQLVKAIPGSFLKHWLYNWYLKVIDDYRIILSSLSNKIDSFNNAWYNWMENFMDMEYGDMYLDGNPQGFVSRTGSGKRLIENYSAIAVVNIKNPTSDAMKFLVGSCEKMLIVVNRIVSPKPELQVPELEIVNIFEDGQSDQLVEAATFRKNPSEKVKRLKASMNRIIRNPLQKIKGIFTSVDLGIPGKILPQLLVVNRGDSKRFGSGFS
jgi:hypothetical protein